MKRRTYGQYRLISKKYLEFGGVINNSTITMSTYGIRKAYFSNALNISNLLKKKGILFENVKREHCKKDLILNYFNIKGFKIKDDDIHIMTNILCRPTGRILVLIDDIKKQNFNFDFDTIKNKESNTSISHKEEDLMCDNNNNCRDDSNRILGNNNLHKNEDHINLDDNDRQAGDRNEGIENKYTDSIDEEASKKRVTYNLSEKNIFSNCKFHICDDYEIEKFVEECERFIRFTEDIKRISSFGNLNKIVTIINIPSCYGRKELSQVIYDCAKIKVKLNNIIFRFKKNGIQSDCAYILCNTANDANMLLNKMQEYPIAKKYHLKEFYGAAFLYASKNNLFISSDKLDYITIFSKYKIFTCGWHRDISIKEFESFLITLKIFPKKIIKINYNHAKKINDENFNQSQETCQQNNYKNNIIGEKSKEEDNNKMELAKTNDNHILINIDECSSSLTNDCTLPNQESETNTSSFILFFENMRMTKKVFTKLERLKKKWKMSPTSNFYAYPKIPDIHFNDEEEYRDENEYEDSDLDEEIEY
ncbi:conserved Plasmodium protein, unknown function [Plasmodium berghei]|uniref:Uncharacterized protein n=2 Tax=Plasmodium berghei TaxID=5821 RepID=A0A509AQK6_PLABA|nr:conserved protein, unknown function [Plasmodium berghei ANKA]CXJ17667.1 conserved Plasmodium protein, unknown function [Plasmodium berghei]SCM26389.1 conserved Plasmodium protein, unknown function [Plasmodium berghei]SCN28430.1 conserved Plasmodium protein, unknown function [Plasmodium berghei]SCO62623.1 conserved Plasmodium protein, unknown function [Plasmodium berghei]SCO64182.1 conserved Plasmodium protein, unknown function [Plasmodium berghei]|eukprot:XP_034424078.1 conserved protein, unknown function [Plasmodium berghei ANKA]